LSRPVAEVLDDVLDDYITVECAAKEYGVVIDAVTMKLDKSATEARRSKGGLVGKETQKRMKATAAA
jgi:hypothetical protein